MNNSARRVFIQQALKLLPVISVAPLVLPARGAESCTDPSSESLRASLHYQPLSSDPKKSCNQCGFFTPADKSSCGQCMIMSGPVDASGHCDSWSAK